MKNSSTTQWDVFGVLFMDHALPKFIYDVATLRILEINHAAVRTYGYARADFGDMTILDLHLPEHMADIEQLAKSNGREQRRHKTVHVTRNGEQLDVDIYSQAIEYDGRPARLATVIDMTVRERAQHALADAETLLQAMIDNVPDPIFIKDLQGHYVFVNKAGAATYGLQPEQVIGRTVADIVGDDAPLFSEHDSEVLRTGVGSTRIVDADINGSRRTLHVTRSPWTDAHGNVRGIIGSIRDITKLRRAEDELRESEEQLRQSQKMEAIGRLAGGIAHDFNNVLTAITGHAEMLKEMFSIHDPRLEDVMEISRAAERATSLTRQLLAFSRHQVMEASVLDMRTVVTDMEKMLERLLGEDVQLLTHFDRKGEVPAIHAGRTQIEQVVMNLAVNARDAMPEGGTLTIAVDIMSVRAARRAVGGQVPPGNYVRLSVSDTGQGIPREVMPNIFEPFFTTKERGRGTGLGLSTVYGIVQRSGGYINVRSASGQGTTFEVLLPHVAETAQDCEEAAATLAAAPLDGSETILLVEDDIAVRSMAERVLERRGYRVLSAANGVAALEIARNAKTIDLVITDLVMPRMSGREFAAEVTRLHEQARVLFMSGYTYEEVAQDGGPESESHFLSKPFTPDGLAYKVRSLLEQS